MPADERVARSVALEQAYVHDVYEEFCDNPRSRPWPKVQRFLQDLEPGSLVCDVGCGNGKYLSINNTVFNIGGDKSHGLCEVAREKENEVLTLDNLNLPFRDESLDAVVSIAVVHHLATTERRICALRELARVLRIGGKIIISVWAMEQSHRKFESQDILVPWHRPKHLSSPPHDLTSTATNSEEEIMNPYHAYIQSDSDSNYSLQRVPKKKTKSRQKKPSQGNSSPSSSSLSSPNETCYSFVRRALQKLAGTRRVVHRPWFLEGWSACHKDHQSRKRYDPDGCECGDCMESIQDVPIELRRIDEEELPRRRQTFPSSQLSNEITSLKSKSMTNIITAEGVALNGSSSSSSINENKDCMQMKEPKSSLAKPRLVKQKKSICEEDHESLEALDQATDMKPICFDLPQESKLTVNQLSKSSVVKQRSLNEEFLFTERLQEKELVRRNIQKQASLNEDLIYHQRHTFDSFKDSFFSVSTAKRFQLIKTGFTNKIKNSTTIEKVTGTSLKNGFVRMFQNWKSSDLISPTIPEDDTVESFEKKLTGKDVGLPLGQEERRHSKEDGSDSSKDSSLQSDTSVDSEDSFASVIFVPKSETMSPTPLSPGPTSPRWKNNPVANSPRIKQSSCPTSPRIKQMPLTLYPLQKQLSSPKPSTELLVTTSEIDRVTVDETTRKIKENLAQKYSVQKIPEFKRTSRNSTETVTANTTSPEKSPNETTRAERLRKIRELLSQKPGFGVRSSKNNFPIVRHSSVSNGKVEAIAKPLPKMLSLELFNPETDDKDSDSSCVSSPDSVDSIINTSSGKKTKFKFHAPKSSKKLSLLEAAQDVANSLDEAVGKVIRSSPKSRRKIQSEDVLNIIERNYNPDTTPLLEGSENWNEDCRKHLSLFADKLSEKLLKEIDQYQEKSKLTNLLDNVEDPYISRLSEELSDLSKLSAEIQKQNEYLAKLSQRDRMFGEHCSLCKKTGCSCKSKLLLSKLNRDPLDQSLTETTKTKSLSDIELSLEDANGKGSTDSCDSEKGSSTNSIVSSTCTSINLQSQESTERFSNESQKDFQSISRCSDGGSTISLASWNNKKDVHSSRNSSGVECSYSNSWSKDRLSLESSFSKDRLSFDSSGSSDRLSKRRDKSILSDASQDSLPTDNVGGDITYHRYYHVFREGELDQLIEKYVENLHIISSYYDHASWCIIAEKVQVWTI